MVGNHDTKPLWRVAEERNGSAWMCDRSLLLAHRLIPEPGHRHAFAARLASDHRVFCEAMFAELFLGPAQNVSVFFADLLGERQLYNQPGTVGEHNWMLRLPGNYRTVYRQRAERGDALSIRRALALALEAKAATLGSEARSLAQRLRG
jgi:4-alpha-glucanotransferase